MATSEQLQQLERAIPHQFKEFYSRVKDLGWKTIGQASGNQNVSLRVMNTLAGLASHLVENNALDELKAPILWDMGSNISRTRYSKIDDPWLTDLIEGGHDRLHFIKEGRLPCVFPEFEILMNEHWNGPIGGDGYWLVKAQSK
jgi:hypothetical protein